jgi:nicotinamide-nucleotide adenylyltransferase
MKALFIGRFQPFHKGHLKIIKEISKEYSKIIIGIGSSQYSHTKENPFTIKERKKMIQVTLKKTNITNYKIIEIPDIHNPPKWVKHVESIYSDFDVVITNNKLNQELFSEKGYKIKKTKMYDRSNLSGKEIRKRILNQQEWKKLVPNPAVKVIEDVNGEQRIIDLHKENNY